MLKLLNRFAWLISIVLGFIIAFVIIWSSSYRIEWEEIFFSGFWWLFVWFFIKWFFLSKNYIKNRLNFFANSLIKDYISDNKENKIYNQEKLEYKKWQDKELENKELENKKLKEEITLDKKLSLTNELDIPKLKVSEQKIETKEIYKPSAFNIALEKTWTYIKDFFSTNTIWKVWSILIFLAIIYFLKWVIWDLWKDIWETWRITIGIITGFITYFIWVFIHKKYKNEAIILMWTWILINFAVILWGRYLVWGDWYLSEWITFLFLILNTVFSVLTSLVYKSKTLLIFSFIFAYFNPFIIWTEIVNQTYTLLWYSLIISLWALFVSFKEKNLSLLIISFIAWNLLFLIADFSNSIEWSFKIILTVTLSLISIFTLYSINKEINTNNYLNKIILIFIWIYIFIILHLFKSSIYIDSIHLNMLWNNIWFIIYNLIILLLFSFSVKIIIRSYINKNFNYSNILLFIPLIILVWILLSWNLIFTSYVLIWTVIIYLIWFLILQKYLSKILVYFYFWSLALFIFLFNLDFTIIWFNKDFNLIEFITILTTSLIFLFSSYYYSTKKDLTSLYPIWTIWTILILSPIIINEYSQLDTETINSTTSNIIELILSVSAIIIFAITNWITPFINKNLINREASKTNIYNLMTWTLAWALFFSYQIYSFWEIYFAWVTEWLVFLLLAIIYFMQAYFISQKIGLEKMKSNENMKNIFYNFVWISISLFSISIAFVFSGHSEIITTTWLFEATILYFFYSKTGSKKIFLAATILFFIWLTKFWILIDVVKKEEYLFLISFSIIFISFILNLFFINKSNNNNNNNLKKSPVIPFSKEDKNIIIHNSHNLLHIVWMIIMSLLLVKIIKTTWHWWSIIWISSFSLIIWYFYAKFKFNLLKIAFLIFITLFSIFHILEVNNIFRNLTNDNLEYLKILEYLTTWLILANIFIWKKLNTVNSYNKYLIISWWLYAFIISNIYVIDIFWDLIWNISLTIYWWLIASILLIYWIQKNIIKFRTIWLYFLILTVLKVIFDIISKWNNNNMAFAFIILWVILIIISILYTRKYWDSLTWELKLENLKEK